MKIIPSGIDDQAEATIKKYQDQAKQLLQQSVQLYVEPKDEADVMSVVRAALSNLDVPDAMVEGLHRSYDISVYDVKCCGECVTHPHLRIMSFRDEHNGKMIRGFLKALLPEESDTLDKDNYPTSALVAALDGGKHQGHQPSHA